jgi:hypothetical protein
MEFIDYVNLKLKELSGKFNYDMQGVDQLLSKVEEDVKNNEEYTKLINDMREVLVKQI